MTVIAAAFAPSDPRWEPLKLVPPFWAVSASRSPMPIVSTNRNAATAKINSRLLVNGNFLASPKTR